MSEYKIGPGMQVTMNFAVKLPDRTVLDTTKEAKPAIFFIGDGNMLPGFEKVIHNLEVGAKETFDIKPEQGFGARNPNNIQEIARNQFPKDIDLKEGLIVSFEDARKTELPGVVSGFEGDMVTVDFNHPLAGKDIVFEVEIIDVQPAEKASA